MNNRSTIKQQFLAASLLAVFLLITAAKLFHTHGTISRVADSSYSQPAATSNDCAVCDYHIAKDADHQANLIMPAKLLAISSPTVSYESRTFSSIGLSYSDRGPPSLN